MSNYGYLWVKGVFYISKPVTIVTFLFINQQLSINNLWQATVGLLLTVLCNHLDYN